MGIVHGGTGCGRGGAGGRKLDDPIVVEVRVVQLAQGQVAVTVFWSALCALDCSNRVHRALLEMPRWRLEKLGGGIRVVGLAARKSA